MDCGLGHMTYFGQWEISDIMQADGWKVLAHWFCHLFFLNFFFGFVISCYFLHPSTIWGSPGKSTKWWDTHGPGTVAMQLKASISKWHQPNSSTSHLTFKRGHPRSPTDLPETTGAWGRPAEWSQANQTSRNAQMNNSILSWWMFCYTVKVC